MIKKLSLLAFLSFFVLVSYGQEAQISNRLQALVEERDEPYIHISILLADRFDVLALDQRLTQQKSSLKERSKTVITALQAHAAQSQTEILSLLRGSDSVAKGSIQEFWIANLIFAEVKPSFVQELGQRADIAQLDLNGNLELVEFSETSPEDIAMLPVPDGAERGLLAINADEMWKMGYTGRGRCVLGSDTGIQPDHPAIKGQYLGLYHEPEQTWYSYNNIIPLPEDCNGHGTHTVGTVLGLDRVTNDTIGVAPNASFIGARILCSMAQGNGGTIDNVASFQWAVDPDGNPDTNADIPDAINNSWHDPSISDEPCNNVYIDVFQALEAVGVAVVFSAGNEGVDDNGLTVEASITHPHNVNYDLVNTFTVGALNANNHLLLIAGFSSRGPSVCGGDSSLLIKPEVSAPGVGVRSAYLDGSYQFLQGTSMACPHVVGAILLLKEAFPYLTGRDLKFALYYTCYDLGDPGEDNDYGMGIIDVKAAFDYLVEQGHQPVDPSVEIDAIVYDFKTTDINCDNQVPGELFFENLGTDTINSMEIEIAVPELGLSEMMSWTGTLDPGARGSAMVAPFDVPNGTYRMDFTITEVNGEDDQFFFNNKWYEEVTSTDLDKLNVDLINTETQVCQNSRALLKSEYPGITDGEVSYAWYNHAQSDFKLSEEQFFLTPHLKDTITYYAGFFIDYGFSEENNEFSSVTLPDTVGAGLTFDVHLPLKLKSVKVYVDSEGTNIVSISLNDNSGEPIDGHNFIVTEPGEHIAELDFDLEVGTGYSLQILGLTPLLYNIGGGEFPYEIDGLISITGNTIEGVGDKTPYLYFYDWKVQHNEICGKTPYTINVSENDSIPIAAFSMSDTIVMIDNNPTITFTDLSDGAVSWQWDFGDGESSTEQNPTHTYNDIGTYQVSLVTRNTLDCEDAVINELQVLEGTSAIDPMLLQEVKVYPNPTQDLLYIEIPTEEIRGTHLLLTDLNGKLMKSIPVREGLITQDLSLLESGVYILIVQKKDRMASFKIVKF